MSFAAPERLWLLVLALALVAAYVGAQVRRSRLARRFANPALLPSLAWRPPGPWRHLLAGVFVAALVVALLGAARPTVPATREREFATIVVALDVSDSMGANDVVPDRITAAVAAARDFVDELPPAFDVGLVTAGASPVVLVAPTTDHQSVLEALGRLELGPGTALGEAIFTALNTIPAADGPGDDRAARIVILSDGVTTTGRPDSEAIAAAQQARVPVSTIAFGTANASVISQGQVVPVPVDESALRAIAEGTGGRFFRAATQSQLRGIYERIDTEVTSEAVDRDVAEWFAGGAFVLLLAAVALSMATTSRVAWT